ncbi:MAG: UDP-N-acetylmuramoyl-L-alanine--D-glutamate ligase [Chloroflexi bacterium]|nr:UDP-N-acetylmuramoyl-L-alanine--D-glutamate ligase [Chloroflexota bacterium]
MANMNWAGKRVVILGLARQGMALARYFAGQGARVVVSDAKPADKLAAELAGLSDWPIDFVLGGHPPTMLDSADLLCLSGGVPADVPPAQEARRRGVPVTNDSQIFLDAAPCPVVGITGSAGKTTTTALVGRILKAEGGRMKDESQPSSFITHPSVWVGGNIGNPLIADLPQMEAGDLAVMELSSFQLEIMTTSPHIAGVLNITPNHLDRHGTMAAYIEAKSHVVRYQRPGDIAVLGWDDDNARKLADAAPGLVWWFTSRGDVPLGTLVRDGDIFLRDGRREQKVGPVSHIKLRGAHNVLNVLAACALAGAAGAPPDVMRGVFSSFDGVAHRLEFVREVNGVKWYNDSIATAPERVTAALHSFSEPLVLLAGGRDKKLPWDELMVLARQRVRKLVVFGEAADLIAEAAEAENMKVESRRYKMAPKFLEVVKCATLAEAVQKAGELARPGDVVLLSPGCTSYDAYKDFVERGEKFREMVIAL